MAARHNEINNDVLETLEAEKDRLEDRLTKGAVIIETRRTENYPADQLEQLEDKWIGLLRKLEDTCEQIKGFNK